jgi:hypothetical protein
MLANLTWLSWLELAAAAFLFLGPGFGLLAFYPGRRAFDRTQSVALALALAISGWAVLLAWLQLFGLTLTPLGVGAILALGWAVWWLRVRPWRWARGWRGSALAVDWSRLALWAVVVSVAALGIWSLRRVLVGPGSDSYHHALITQLIVERGGLPDDYRPYAPLTSFTYHYGYHAFAAAIVALTGLGPALVTAVLAQALTAAAALSESFFTEAATGSRTAAALSAVVSGLVILFPAYMFNWGRYTQLTGLVLLPIFLGVVWLWARSGWSERSAFTVGVLAAGLALTHYRVTLMAVTGLATLLGVEYLTRREFWSDWRQVLRSAAVRLASALAVAGVLVAPWVWHVMSVRGRGFPIELAPQGPAFFSMSRLGPSVTGYPTNPVVFGLAALAVLLGLLRRDRLVMGLALWSAVMWILSGPRFAGAFMDTISVLVSLYFPAAVAVGWMAVRLVESLASRTGRARAVRWAAWLAVAGVGIWGAAHIAAILEPPAAYVWPDDVPAMAWIREHAPSDALFMVNTYNWDFSPDLVIGPDAGYWLPLLAGRSTVTAPMTYPIERADSADFLSQLVSLHAVRDRLASPEGLAELRQAGVTHVYVGQKGGPIGVDDLLASPAFELVHRSGDAYVFRLIERR